MTHLRVPRMPVKSVYVHVPFCERQCGYCDFAISVGRDPDAEDWFKAISREWQERSRRADLHIADQLDTLYVGGGTPSMLGASAMSELRRVFGDAVLSGAELEWSAEANPESMDTGLLTAWHEAGVTRLSVGVQSFHDPTLRWMGRLHGPEGGEEAIRLARKTPFTSLTVDLIFGVPRSLGRSWTADLDRILSLDVPHISLYGLTVEVGTPLHRAVAEGRTAPIDHRQYEEEYLEAAERLRAEGYEHYEVSSFARPGHRSRHNQQYWTGEPYVGLGNGAHSFQPPVRSWNERAWIDYRDAVAAHGVAPADSETVDGDSAELERLWLGLRRCEGVPKAWISAETAARWQAEGYAFETDDRLRLTPQGWLLLDDLAVEASRQPSDSISASQLNHALPG